jgi:hypothetical protein
MPRAEKKHHVWKGTGDVVYLDSSLVDGISVTYPPFLATPFNGDWRGGVALCG